MNARKKQTSKILQLQLIIHKANIKHVLILFLFLVDQFYIYPLPQDTYQKIYSLVL